VCLHDAFDLVLLGVAQAETGHQHPERAQHPGSAGSPKRRSARSSTAKRALWRTRILG
jgi:hypothetical protein